MASNSGLIPLVKIQPKYPREALKGGKTGFVTVRLTVDEKGRVISAIIEESRPPRIFDAAAIQAVLKWKFKPRVIDGVPVKQVGLTTIEFNLYMKKFLFLILIVSFNVSAAEQAITQWVYNTLERAQANLDKGNIEAAERIYYDYANDTWSSRSYDHFVILRTYAYFFLSNDRNEEALRYLKQASLKRDMPPYDIFEFTFTLGQVYYVTGDREMQKKPY